jgi:hypothetical protein
LRLLRDIGALPEVWKERAQSRASVEPLHLAIRGFNRGFAHRCGSDRFHHGLLTEPSQLRTILSKI